MKSLYSGTMHRNDDEEYVPDQSLFEPDPALENAPPSAWDRWWPIVRTVVGGIAVIGLLYTAGIYHGLLLSETPEHVTQEEIAPIVEGMEYELPVTIILVRGTEGMETSRERNNARSLVSKAANIWSQARVGLQIKQTHVLDVNRKQKERFLTNPRDFMAETAVYNPDHINVVLTGTLQGLNGIAIGGSTGVVVADVTSHYDFRTLAHEIGHVLGLQHTDDPRRLMSQGSYGTSMTVAEVRTAREHAQEIQERE